MGAAGPRASARTPRRRAHRRHLAAGQWASADHAGIPPASSDLPRPSVQPLPPALSRGLRRDCSPDWDGPGLGRAKLGRAGDRLRDHRQGTYGSDHRADGRRPKNFPGEHASGSAAARLSGVDGDLTGPAGPVPPRPARRRPEKTGLPARPRGRLGWRHPADQRHPAPLPRPARPGAQARHRRAGSIGAAPVWPLPDGAGTRGARAQRPHPSAPGGLPRLVGCSARPRRPPPSLATPRGNGWRSCAAVSSASQSGSGTTRRAAGSSCATISLSRTGRCPASSTTPSRPAS